MATPKPQYQVFTQQWNKTVNWAKSNNIPYSAYYPVYQMDAQRMMSGSPMSESERIRAIQAAAGLNYSTSLPTDNQDWTNVLQNAKTNATDIFTGMEPQNILGSLWGTVANTFEHPSGVYNAFEDVGKILNPFAGHKETAAAIHSLGQDITQKNSILQFIPGALDIGKVAAASSERKGLESLATTPITSLIDIVPFGRAASEALGSTKIGAAAADKIGMSTEELRKAGIWRVGGKYIMAKGAPSLFARMEHPFLTSMKDPETGALTDTGVKDYSKRIGVTAVPSNHDMWSYFKDKIGAGSEQAAIQEELFKYDAEGTREVRRWLEPAFKQFAKLNKDEQIALTRWSQSDFRSLEEKMADESVPRKIRDAYEAAWNWWQKKTEIDMQTGYAQSVRSPFNDVDVNGKPYFNPDKPPVYETYYVDTPAYKHVTEAQDAYVKAEKAREEGSRPIAGLLYKMDENDSNIFGAFKVLGQLREQLYASIQRSIPSTQGVDAADRLHQTLPENARIERGQSSAFLTEAERNSPTLRNLFGLPPEMKKLSSAERRLFPSLRQSDFPKTKELSTNQVNAIHDLFSPGGLLDRMVEAYRTQDWAQLVLLSNAAMKKWDGAAFKEIPKGGQLDRMRTITRHTQQYARERKKLADEVNKRMIGYKDGKKISTNAVNKSVGVLSRRSAEAAQKWMKVAVQNPPDVWRNVLMEQISSKVAQEEKTAAAIEDTSKELSRQGWVESQLTQLRRDPYTMQEIMTGAAKASVGNDILPDIDHEEVAKVTQDQYEELASLRARGEQPLYVHMTAPGEKYQPTWNVYIHGISPRRPGSVRAAVWGYTPSVYDIGAGMLEATKQMVERDMTQRFVEQELIPRLHDAGSTQAILRNYFAPELEEVARSAADDQARINGATAVMSDGLRKFNLISFKASEYFGQGFSHPSLNAAYYIDGNLAKAFKRGINEFQFPAQSIVDRGTKLFRFSILGLSPRYTAHILFGGSYMVALRAHPSIFKFMGNAVFFALHGSFSERTYSKFHPDFAPELKKAETEFSEQATEEGEALATAMFHKGAMNTAGRHWLIPEWLSRHGFSDTTRNRIRAAAEINLRFTRAIRRAQNAAVFLDGASRALREGSMYYHTDWEPREAVNPEAHTDLQVDEQGRNVYHPVTKKLMHDEVRSKSPMTPQQAHVEGMKAVAEVMGNLRHMTPLERSLLARVFPFYGWTKHVLQYVLSYPFDHPWRAMIVSNIAEQNSLDTASGLPLRIQLLTFLGSPDAQGNVTALDTKSLDPFRDTANYASLTGLFESLNPAITGVGALVDPQISFAGQNLYPQVTFNSLYGVKQAGAQENFYQSAEQFVPQLGAIDAAFNLSGQYAYLKQSNPTAFTKKIFESFGLPFTPQSLNLRQIAAKQEIDRYQIASQAAYTAATDPSSNALAGYAPNAQIPDPLNTIYNVTPAYIAAMNQESEATYGLPFYETTTPPRTPANL